MMAFISGAQNALALTSAESSVSHPYTCNACQVAFQNGDLQKSHMRSDWHRYNLKRKVASLPPISLETFAEKVLLARTQSSAQADRVGFQKACEACEKVFYSENQYNNHAASGKHKARVAAFLSRGPRPKAEDDASSMITSTFSLGEPTGRIAPSERDSDVGDDVEDVAGIKNTAIADDQAADASVKDNLKGDQPTNRTLTFSANANIFVKTDKPSVSLKHCLFCNYESPTVTLSAVHMERIHGMFIPEKKYLVDLEGLLGALQHQILKLQKCISCHKVKADVFAVQTHMRDSSHCRIPYHREAEQLEIGEFYDFRGTYSDENDSDDESSGGEEKSKRFAKLGLKRQTMLAGDTGEELSTGEDDGWETDSSGSSIESDEIGALPADLHYHQFERLEKHPHHSSEDHRAHHQRDGWHAHNHRPGRAFFYDEFELHLPGKSVGNRKFRKYYRQNLLHYPTPEERAERLAIAAADAENCMDVDGQAPRDVALRDNRHRPTVNRETAGLGVTATEQTSPRVRAIMRANRMKEFAGQRAKEAYHSKGYFKEKHKNHASFF